MSFFGPVSMVGVEIDDHAIRVAQLHKTGKGWTVRRAGSVLLPVEARDPARNDDRVAALLSGLVQSLGLGGQQAWVSVTPTAINTLNLPKLSKKELREAVGWELSRTLTFSLEGAHLVWYVKSSVGEGRQEILASASPRRAVARLVRAVQTAGLEAVGVTPRAYALAAACGRSMGDEERRAILHLGDSSTSLVVVGPAGLEFHREINVGGKDILKSLTRQVFSDSGSIDLNLAEAEEVRKKFRIGQTEPVAGPRGTLDPLQLLAMIRPDLEKIGSEMERSLEFSADASGQEVDRLLLTGDVLDLEGVKRFLVEDLAVHAPVEVADPLLGMAIERHAGDPATNAALAVSTGAAFAGLTGGPVNYLPGHLHLRRSLVVAKAAGVVLPLVLGSIFAWHGTTVRPTRTIHESTATRMRSDLEEIGKVQVQARSAITERETLKARLAELESSVGMLAYAPASEVLQELSRLVPEGVFLEAVEINEFRLRVVANVGQGPNILARKQDLANALQGSPFFDNVGVQSLAARSGQVRAGSSYEYRARILPWRGAAPFGADR